MAFRPITSGTPSIGRRFNRGTTGRIGGAPAPIARRNPARGVGLLSSWLTRPAARLCTRLLFSLSVVGCAFSWRSSSMSYGNPSLGAVQMQDTNGRRRTELSGPCLSPADAHQRGAALLTALGPMWNGRQPALPAAIPCVDGHFSVTLED